MLTEQTIQTVFMPKIRCPFCNSEVEIISFGFRFIAMCCGQVVFASQELPPYYDKSELLEEKNVLETLWKVK